MKDMLKAGGVFDRALSAACNGRKLADDEHDALRGLQKFVLTIGAADGDISYAAVKSQLRSSIPNFSCR